MVLILGIAGGVAANRFKNLDDTRKELDQLLIDTQNKLKTQIQALEDLKLEFQTDKEEAIKLLFPLSEAQWYNYQGDYQKSIEAYKKAQKIKPEDRLIADKLNKLLVEKGDTESAIENLEKILKIHQDDIQLNRRLVEAYRRNGDFDSAEVVINKVLKKFDHPALYYELGCIRLFSGRYLEAEQCFKNSNRFFFSNDGKYSYWVFANLSVTQELLGKEKEAIANSNKAVEILEKRVKITPKNPHIWSYLGLAYLVGEKKYQKARFAYEQAIQFNLPNALASSLLERIELLYKEGSIKTVRYIINKLRIYVDEDSNDSLIE